jgi:putative sigma-54 modulation protein
MMNRQAVKLPVGCCFLRSDYDTWRPTMQLVIKGKNMDVSEKLKQFVESKVTSRLQRVLPDIAEVDVEVTYEKTRSTNGRYVAEITLSTGGTLIRGEQTAADSYSAVDAVLDKIDRQVVRYRSKRSTDFIKGAAAIKANAVARREAAEYEGQLPDDEEEEGGRVVRVKRFAMKPMDPEEAIMQMEMLGHDFFVFSNTETNSVGVVYRRKDGNFGLIEPEAV